MNENNKSYRIKANIGGESVINVNLNQDYDTFDILSLKIGLGQGEYRNHNADYGCIVGRVLANEGVGVPNVKVSMFIETNESVNIDTILHSLYPYKNIQTQNNDYKRYNLLPDEQLNDCHVPVGSFPNKRLVLDDDNIIEIFDKYYKFSTITNNAGDYMLFGVPTGNCIVHIDADISDIGFLSQKPRDLIYKGYDINQFANANQFKTDKNIDGLTQIVSQDDAIYVYPFWGDAENTQIAISRNDINLQYRFEPTCVFMGSLVSDSKEGYFNESCKPTKKIGDMKEISGGEGTIEMVRKTIDNSVESFVIQGNQLVDSDGVWCYQIPMNLDYIVTDEYGNIVPSQGSSKGLPTRTSVRFRISLNDFDSDTENAHLVKILVPNNPKEFEDIDYNFGTLTTEKNFRDLMWNNVYTVKSYIPRIQEMPWHPVDYNEFTGFKNVSASESKNPIPYNNMRVHMNFTFILQCTILKFMIRIASFLNRSILVKLLVGSGKCISVGDGMCPQLENWYFAPGCKGSNLKKTADNISSTDNIDSASIGDTNSPNKGFCVTNKTTHFMQCVEISLALKTEIIRFDFFNDWINGLVYIPRWYAKIKKRRKWFFGLFGPFKSTLKTCSDTIPVNNNIMCMAQPCALEYRVSDNNFIINDSKNNKSKKINSKVKYFTIFRRDSRHKNGNGIVHGHPTVLGQTVYYLKSNEWYSPNFNNSKKVNMFATDIVLLGSLNDCDEKGIPQFFKNLEPTTFHIPPAIAETNVGLDGYIYRTEGHKNCICIGRNYDDKALQAKNDGYDDFIRNTDYYDSSADGNVDYPVTETAGIDWGYIGPGQGENNDDFMFKPGGHFLGIGCWNSEVMAKSCVNLSRICELGANISKRESVPYVYEDEYTQINHLKYNFLIPTGFISDNEINDVDAREMFATLNSKGLETEYNSKTGRREYTFTPLKPISFDGSLNNIINKTPSEGNLNPYFEGLVSETGITNNKAYKFVAEGGTNVNNDYLKFRFGIDELSELPKHFINGTTLEKMSFPMYENSFYFYFGINEGSTALNKFYKNYFTECPEMKSYNSDLKITSSNTTFCQKNSGEIKLEFINMEAPYTVNAYMTDTYGARYSLYNGSGITSGITINNNLNTYYGNNHDFYTSIITFKNLPSGTYLFETDSEDTIGVERTVEIIESPLNLDACSGKTKAVNFSDKLTLVYDNGVCLDLASLSNGGYLDVTNLPNSFLGNTDTEEIKIDNILIKNSSYYAIKNNNINNIINWKEIIINWDEIIINETLINNSYTENDNRNFFKLWNMQSEYDVYLIIHCNNNNEKYLYYLQSHILTHSDIFDIAFGDDNENICTLTQLENIEGIGRQEEDYLKYNYNGNENKIYNRLLTKDPMSCLDGNNLQKDYCSGYMQTKGLSGTFLGHAKYNRLDFNFSQIQISGINAETFSNWVNKVLTSSGTTAKMDFAFKSALYFRNSLYTFDGDTCRIKLKGISPKVNNLLGMQSVIDSVDGGSMGYLDIMNLSINNVNIPVLDNDNILGDVYMPNENVQNMSPTNSFFGYNKQIKGINNSITPYKIDVTDENNPSIDKRSFYFPIIYKPRFTKTIAIFDEMKSLSGETDVILRLMVFPYNLLPGESCQTTVVINDDSKTDNPTVYKRTFGINVTKPNYVKYNTYINDTQSVNIHPSIDENVNFTTYSYVDAYPDGTTFKVNDENGNSKTLTVSSSDNIYAWIPKFLSKADLQTWENNGRDYSELNKKEELSSNISTRTGNEIFNIHSNETISPTIGKYVILKDESSIELLNNSESLKAMFNFTIGITDYDNLSTITERLRYCHINTISMFYSEKTSESRLPISCPIPIYTANDETNASQPDEGVSFNYFDCYPFYVEDYIKLNILDGGKRSTSGNCSITITTEILAPNKNPYGNKSVENLKFYLRTSGATNDITSPGIVYVNKDTTFSKGHNPYDVYYYHTFDNLGDARTGRYKFGNTWDEIKYNLSTHTLGGLWGSNKDSTNSYDWYSNFGNENTDVWNISNSGSNVELSGTCAFYDDLTDRLGILTNLGLDGNLATTQINKKQKNIMLKWNYIDKDTDYMAVMWVYKYKNT